MSQRAPIPTIVKAVSEHSNNDLKDNYTMHNLLLIGICRINQFLTENRKTYLKNLSFTQWEWDSFGQAGSTHRVQENRKGIYLFWSIINETNPNTHL